MVGRVYADESKARDYLLVAAVVLPTDATLVRKGVRSLILPRQERVHMVAESDSRRRQVLSTLQELNVGATVYRAQGRHRTQLTARKACLERIVQDMAVARHEHLTLESDSTQDQRDRQTLIEATRRFNCRGSLTYEHLAARHEPLLIVPDAIAWAFARGGEWAPRVQPLIVGVIDV